MKRRYLTEDDFTGLSHDEFVRAMKGLVKKGLMEAVKCGETWLYRPTPLAISIRRHVRSARREQS